MKKTHNLIFLILLLLACNNKKHTSNKEQKAENTITKIVFFENNTSVPANFELHKYKQIEIVNDGASLIEYIYKNGELNETKKLKTLKLNLNEKVIFSSLPNEYLKKNKYSIGNPSPLNEDIFKTTITLNNNKKIVWEMNYDKKRIPKEILPFYQLYFHIRQELYKTN